MSKIRRSCLKQPDVAKQSDWETDERRELSFYLTASAVHTHTHTHTLTQIHLRVSVQRAERGPDSFHPLRPGR